MKHIIAKKYSLWLLAALLVLILSVTLLTACESSGGGTTTSDSTTADGAESPAPTDPDGSTREPDSSTAEPVDTDDTDSTDPTDTLTEAPTAEPTEPPVITLPADDTAAEPQETEEETLPYDPDLHPGDASLYKGVLIHSVYGTGKKGAEALMSNGYVQLYNNSDKDISLAGASLYYKSDGANPFDQFVFPAEAVIPAGGYYLVRANSPTDFDPAKAVMKVEYCDAEWDVYLDNKEIRLLLAPSGWSIGRDEDITVFDDAVSVFVATMEYHSSVYALYDLSRNKVAVRTAMEDYSGYHTVNLTRSATPELRDLRI